MTIIIQHQSKEDSFKSGQLWLCIIKNNTKMYITYQPFRLWLHSICRPILRSEADWWVCCGFCCDKCWDCIWFVHSSCLFGRCLHCGCNRLESYLYSWLFKFEQLIFFLKFFCLFDFDAASLYIMPFFLFIYLFFRFQKWVIFVRKISIEKICYAQHTFDFNRFWNSLNEQIFMNYAVTFHLIATVNVDGKKVKKK